MDLSPRAVIAGRYRIDTKLGAGGMGEVWAGEQIGLGTRVAIKALLPAAAINNEVVARFRREAMFLSKIRSDHVARVVDFVEDGNYGLVLVMELVTGEPLSSILQKKSITVEETVELGVDICSALKDLHTANIIHRDLKPGNIIMTPLPDGRRRAVVVDFGVSRFMNDKSKDEDEEITGITRADMAVGTIEYMAPEQILNSRNVAPGSDIYAAGAMIFRAVSGQHIFGNVQSDAELAQKKLTTEAPGLPLTRNDRAAEGLQRVVARMIKRRPSERYKSADEVLADLVPVRDLARGAAAELDSTTVDASRGLPVALPGGAPAAGAAPTSPATPVAVAAVAAAAVGPVTPVSRPIDSAASVTAPQPPKPEAAPRRGVPPIVTLGLVAAALVGGVFLGPRLMAPAAPVAAATPSPAPPAASAAPSAVPVASSAVSAEASAAPAASEVPAASAEPAASAAPVASVASATPSASPAAGASASAAPAVAPPPPAPGAPAKAPAPGPLPGKAAPTAAAKATSAPTTAPAAPPKPAPVNPDGI